MAGQYFIVVDGEEKGPFPLEQLPAQGVRPSTYVWTKGMTDWQQAEEVPEVCRLFRQHLDNLMHPPVLTDLVEKNTPKPDDSSVNSSSEEEERQITGFPIPPLDLSENIDEPPRVSMTLAILVCLLCFPPTGFVAIFYTYKAQKTWQQHLRNSASTAVKSSSATPDEEPKDLRAAAHDFARLSKMWTGITISLGLIFYAFIFSRNANNL